MLKGTSANTTHLLVSLSGGVDVILQELGLDLILQVSEQSIISLLQRTGGEERRALFLV